MTDEKRWEVRADSVEYNCTRGIESITYGQGSIIVTRNAFTMWKAKSEPCAKYMNATNLTNWTDYN